MRAITRAITRDGVLVVAKAPVPGQAKTRLAASVGETTAAEIAAAALLDTLDACEQVWSPPRRVLALSGDLSRASRSAEINGRLAGWRVLPQHGETFAERLERAHRDASSVLGSPVLQLGTDTPQLVAHHLHRLQDVLAGRACDAVIGPALDGGWWALGVTKPGWLEGLRQVPMSTSHTGVDTVLALQRAGARVQSGGLLRDVDEVQDAWAVSLAAPGTRFAEVWRDVASRLGLTEDRRRSTASEAFDAALAGAPCRVHGMPDGPRDLPVSQWQAECTPADHVMIDQCVGPTLDIGCGPGRLTQELRTRGDAALGIDIAPHAVRQTRARGAWALHRDVFEALPGEGHWRTALLADGNIGIGGSPEKLLRRVATLVTSSGRIVVETAAPGLGEQRFDLRLEANGRISNPFPWAVIGLEALAALAITMSLSIIDVVSRDGRWFASLVKSSDYERRCG